MSGATDIASFLSANDKYPHFAPNTFLLISPQKSALYYQRTNASFSVGQNSLELLTECNGTKTVGTLIAHLDKKHSSDFNIILPILVDFANAIGAGMIVLSDICAFTEPDVRGSIYTYFPQGLQIELTARCNLNCAYCYRTAVPSKEKAEEPRLLTSQLLKILNNLYAKGLQTIELTGGEPMLHPDFFEILQFCHDQFALVGILTNGTLFTQATLDKILPFKDKTIFSISLDSHIPHIHDQRRGCAGAFNKTISTIKGLSERKFQVRVSMALNQENWPHIEETITLSRQLGATLFTYAPILPFGRANKEIPFWNLDIKQVSDIQSNLKQKHGDFLQFIDEPTLLKIEEPGGCGAGHRVFAMDPTGRIRPCVTFEEKQSIIGSLDIESPDTVFGRPLVSAFAQLAPPSANTCGSCNWLSFCKHCNLRGLLASAWISEGNCKWLSQTNTQKWNELVQRHSQ